VQRPLGLVVEAGFQAWKDTNQQVVRAGQALGLGIDQVAPPTDEQPDLEIAFGRRIDRPQVGAGADLVGDGARVARIGLVLAPHGALAGAVDGQARDVNERQPRCGQHGFGKAGDAPNDIEADAYGAAKADELLDQRRYVSRRVRQLAIKANHAVGIDGRDPMRLLGDIDPNTDPHGAPRQVIVTRHPARAVVALHSDGSQRLESNQRSRRYGGAGGSASGAIMGSQHENHPGTAAAPRSWHARIVVSGTAEAATQW
jgi:hypothetical protein